MVNFQSCLNHNHCIPQKVWDIMRKGDELFAKYQYYQRKAENTKQKLIEMGYTEEQINAPEYP